MMSQSCQTDADAKTRPAVHTQHILDTAAANPRQLQELHQTPKFVAMQRGQSMHTRGRRPTMADVSGDQFALIKIEGMHCHKCQQAIQKSLERIDGVHEVEVDFLSGQASVLFDPRAAKVRQLVDAVTETGYRPTGFTTQNRAGHAHP